MVIDGRAIAKTFWGEAWCDNLERYRTDYVDRLHLATAHNDYALLLAEGGLLVGLPILVTLAAFIREIRRRFREAQDDTMTYCSAPAR